jgi:hypothetical protein
MASTYWQLLENTVASPLCVVMIGPQRVTAMGQSEPSGRRGKDNVAPLCKLKPGLAKAPLGLREIDIADGGTVSQ